jgi:glyoxylase-like metal-dependent hydrolase (beta-lactamase superfamily II)
MYTRTHTHDSLHSIHVHTLYSITGTVEDIVFLDCKPIDYSITVMIMTMHLYPQGHTAGSLCVMVETDVDTVMFTGDTLAYSASRKSLEGFKYVHTYAYSCTYTYIRSILDASSYVCTNSHIHRLTL